MKPTLPNLEFSSEVQKALNSGIPLVALESTVITHGLPYPQNLEMAFNVEATIQAEGACPATVAILNGTIHVGLNKDQLEELVHEDNVRKISSRDFATVIVRKSLEAQQLQVLFSWQILPGSRFSPQEG